MRTHASGSPGVDVMGMHAPGWATMLVALSLGFGLGSCCYGRVGGTTFRNVGPSLLRRTPNHRAAEAASNGFAVSLFQFSGLMWPSWLCGLQPVDAQDSALSRSGTPHNFFLVDSNRPGMAGHVSLATTNVGAGVDRQIRASSWANR